MSTSAEAARLAREAAELASEFDAEFYATANPFVAEKTDDLLGHFCAYGWRELRKPNRGFDIWWYWSNYLDPANDEVNPLLHYVRTGRAEGMVPRPVPPAPRPTAPLPADRPVRRACLFAGFDAEGRVDESVLLYLRELSRFADVYCLFDNYLPVGELDKLRAVVKDAWAVRHAAYDFGSYSMLARDLVGWDQLAGYDEVVLANDSCYLLRPLDEVFARMDSEPCDWWGMQATKGTYGTRDVTSHFTQPIPLDTVKRDLLSTYEEDEAYDFHIGSYFLAFRRPVLDDMVFRRLLESVSQQKTKKAIIQKYEIGITHLLIGRGYAFSTFIEELFPFHPVYTDWAFRLIEKGYPLLKRYFLYQNHYDTPGLARWKERISALVPDAPVEVFERNLQRVAPADKLHRSFAIETGPDGTIDVPEMIFGPDLIAADEATPKRDDWWAFMVDPVTHALPENSRALFEQVAQDPNLTKFVLTRSRRIELGGRSVVTHPLLSPEGQDAMLRSGVLFVSRMPHAALSGRISPELHHIVAVRQGLMLLKHGRTLDSPRIPAAKPPPPTGRLRMLHKPIRPNLSAVLTASDVDQTAEIAAQWPARYADGWRTGLPAHDFLVADDLPADLADQERRLRTSLDGRRLVLLVPIERRKGSELVPYPFTSTEVRELAAAVHDHGAVIGIRESWTDLDRPYSAAFGELAMDLSPHIFSSTAAVLRVTDVLVTDYDGTALDFTVTGRPVIGFAPDLEDAADALLYDYTHMFPGPVCRDVGSLSPALATALDEPSSAIDRQYERVRDLLVDYRDGKSGARVVERVRQILEGKPR